jgi:hypothetical protein
MAKAVRYTFEGDPQIYFYKYETGTIHWHSVESRQLEWGVDKLFIFAKRGELYCDWREALDNWRKGC